jgi:hypothetical protein
MDKSRGITALLVKSYFTVAIGSLGSTKVVEKIFSLMKNLLVLSNKCAGAQFFLGATAETMILTKIPITATEFFSATKKLIKNPTGPGEMRPESSLTTREEFLRKGSDLLSDSKNAAGWVLSAFQLGGTLWSMTIVGNCAAVMKSSLDLWEASLSIVHVETIFGFSGAKLSKNEMEDLTRLERLCWIRVAKSVIRLASLALKAIAIFSFQVASLNLAISSVYCVGCIWDSVYEDMSKEIKEARTRSAVKTPHGIFAMATA